MVFDDVQRILSLICYKEFNSAWNWVSFLLHHKYIFDSLTTSHDPDLQIYNADLTCSIPTVIMEMLFFSIPGLIELLPALPDALSKGSIC